MNAEQALQMIDAVAAQLGEHFEAVEILASFPLEGGTQCIKRGRGNWYARQGMAHEFIGSQRGLEIAEQLSQPDDND
jgi:hypothetical protein